MNAEPPNSKPRWFARKVPNGCAWTLLLLPVVLLLTPMLLTWVFHPGFSHVNSKAFVTRVLSSGRQLSTALKIYASDNDGKYPTELRELVTAGVLNNLDTLLASPLETGPLGWIYLPGYHMDSPADQPILISPILQNRGNVFVRWRREQQSPICLPPAYPIRVVVTNDSTATTMKEEDFQRLLKAKGLTLPSGTEHGSQP